MSNSLQILADNRDALLLAEVAAWLHNYEKCSDKHLRDHTQDPPSGSVIDPTQYLSLLGTHTIHLLGENVDLIDLIKKVSSSPDEVKDTSKEWLIRALGFCHSAAHTEKTDHSYYLRLQKFTHLRFSNPFGYDSFPSSTSNTPPLTNRLNNLLGQLAKFLPYLPSNRFRCKQHIEGTFNYALADTRRPLNDVTLWDWSNMVAALYKAAIVQVLIDGPVEPPFSLQWRLLGVRVNGTAFSENVTRIPDLKARQELLRDGLDKVCILLEEIYPLGTEVYRDTNGSVFIVPNIPYLLDLENGQGKSLADLIRSKLSTGTVNGDSTLSLGDEIVPALEFETQKQAWFWKDAVLHHDPLPIADHITQTPASHAQSAVVRSWWQDHREDICTVCQLRPQGWGAHDHEEHYRRKTRGEPCLSRSACQTCKALQRKVCAICERRRENQSSEWSRKLSTTIWIDEVADINGRVALVVGKFDLKTWFNGDSLFYPQERQDGKKPIQVALRVKNLGDKLDDGKPVRLGKKDYVWQEKSALLVSASLSGPSQFKPPDPFQENKLYVTDIRTLVTVKDVRLSADGQYQIVLDNHPSTLAAGTQHSISGQKFRVSDDGLYLETMSDMAKKVIEEKILHYQSLKIEKHFILPILEPPPAEMVEAQAPTRLFRVWETCRSFWEDAVSDFKKPDTVGEVPRRLQIEATFYPKTANQTLDISHTYELKLGEINLSIACTNRNTYLTVDNLRRTAFLLGASKAEYENDSQAAEYVQGYLEGKTFDIEEPTGYGSSNKALGKLKVTAVKPENTSYVPAVPILKEPRTFMALVPADKALQVARAIKEKYEDEMGKVRNRLPLTLGVVFAGARTPLPAILDAGRRMLKQPIEPTQWQVKAVDLHLYPEKVLLTLGPGQGGEPSLPLDIPAIMGDGETEDVWYPYWCLEKEAANASERKRKFKGIDGKYWTHVSDLQVGDVVSFMPSRLDFEYLDTAARRFEISYDNGKRRGSQQPGSSYHPARPYYLEQLDEFDQLWKMLSQGLETTQIYTLIGIIEGKRMEWSADQDNETFKQTIRDTLNNANWKPRLKPDQFEQLYRAALSGQLTDVAELYVQLNQQPEADKSQTEIAKLGVNS